MKKKPFINTVAYIRFTRHFYKYQKPTESSVLKEQFEKLEESIAKRVSKIFD